MNKIFGIGTDIIKNSRLENLLEKSYKKRFIERVLHLKEIEQFHLKPNIKSQSQFLASRWAYKEALVKASGRKDLIFSRISLRKDINGKPKVELEESNRKILEIELGIKYIHLSITHEDDYSLAFIVLEI